MQSKKPNVAARFFPKKQRLLLSLLVCTLTSLLLLSTQNTRTEDLDKGLSFVANTPEQLAQVDPAEFTNLTAEDLELISANALSGATTEQLAALPADIFQDASSQIISRFLVNLDATQIPPTDVARLLPADWQINLNTGELTVPPGTSISLPDLALPDNLPPNLQSLPTTVNLSTSFGLGGQGGTPLIDALDQTLEAIGAPNLSLTQNETGVLRITGDVGGLLLNLAFMVDAQQITQAESDSPANLVILPNNQFVLITREGLQVPLIPSPQSLIQIAELVGLGSQVSMGDAGDVVIDPADGDPLAALFSFFITDTLSGLAPGLHTTPSESGAPGEPSGFFVFEDGSAQQMLPYVPAPELFTELVKALSSDIELARFDLSDGTMTVRFNGVKIQLVPHFALTPLATGNTEPTLMVNPDLTLDYVMGEYQARLSIMIFDDDINTAPTITSAPTTSATVNRGYQYNVEANDADGDTFSFSLAQAPTGMRIHSGNGLITWRPDATGDVDVEVIAQDSNGKQATQRYTITVADSTSSPTDPEMPFTPQRPIDLAPIGDQSIALGRTLELQLEAFSANGEPFILSARPLPLPDNASFDSTTGLFRFKPAETQVADFDITFMAIGESFTDSEAVKISVNGPDPNGITTLTGRLLDTNAFVNGVEMPITGATVTIMGSGVMATTDAQGQFTLNDVPSGEQIFDIDTSTAADAPDGSGYAGFRERIELIDKVDNVVSRPFYLPRIATNSLTTVDPSTTTEVINPDLGTMIMVPPNTARSDGRNFTGQLSISEVPNALAPAALPENLAPSMLITIQPVGVTFNTPVPITFPNTDGLAPGSETDIWSLDPETGQFIVVGTGRVSDDGSVIETIDGGVRAADWHLTLPPMGDVMDEGNNDENQDPDKCEDPCTGSRTAVSSGNLIVEHNLPSYRSFDINRSVKLSYNSNTAYPRPIITTNITIPRRSALPELVSTRLSVGGFDTGETIFISTEGLQENSDEALRAAAQFNASEFETGLYPYRLNATNHFRSSAVSGQLRGNVLVNNARLSAVGAGWGIAEVQKIKRTFNGGVVITDGDGTQQVFGLGTLDLSDWLQEGSSNGNWVVADGSSSVLQTRNSDEDQPTFFVSPNSFINTTIRGTFTVEDFSDNDFIGFVLGYQAPLNENGDEFNDWNFLIFDWKQSSQTISGIFGDEGFALSQASGTVELTDVGDALWGHVDSANFTVLATDFGDDKGWLPNVEHSFEAVYQQNRVRINIDNATIFDVQGTFQAGRFGFYNLSQEDVRYTSFSSTSTFESPAGDFSRLIQRTDGGFTRTLKNGTRIEFNAEGLQTDIIDTNGNTTHYDYDAQQRLIRITDPAGLFTQFRYAGEYLSEIEDPAGRITRLSHDANGNLTQIEDPDGSMRTFVYNEQHHLVTQTSKRGFDTTYEYNAAGRNITAILPDGMRRNIDPSQSMVLPNSVNGLGNESSPLPAIRPDEVVARFTDANGNTRIYETDRFGAATQLLDSLGRMTLTARDNDSLPIQIQRSNGAVQTRSYDTQGNILSVTEEAIDATTVFTYEPNFNQITSITDAEGNTTNLEYDANGNLVTVTDANGTQTSFAYADANCPGQMTMLIRAVGLSEENTSTFQYDANTCNLNRRTDAEGNVTTYAYNSVGSITTITEGVGTSEQQATTFTYDAMNRLLTVRDGEGNTSRRRYDDTSNLIELISPTGESQTRIYDSRNRLTQINDPTAGDTSFTYDNENNVTQSIDAVGAVTQFEYDDANRVTRSIDAEGHIRQFTYDDNDNLTQVTDARGNTTRFTYDLVDRLTRRTNPLNQRREFTYDKLDNLIRRIDAENQQINYSYDALSRLTTVNTPDNQIEFTYDALSRTTRVQDMDSDFIFMHDGLDRLLTAETMGPQPAVTLTNSYDAVGNRTRLTDSLGEQTSFGYDRANRMTEVVTPSGQPIALAYDAASRFTQIAFPNGTTSDYRYDNQGRLAQILHQTNGGATQLAQLDYLYNAVGSVTRITEPGRVRDFSYDALQQLIGGGTNTEPETYEYDPEGNRLNSHLSNLHEIDDNNQLEEDDRFTYVYDDNGNLITRTEKTSGDQTSYSYDAQNQLIQVIPPTGNPITYAYDGLGRRIEKNVAGVITRYVYDGQDIAMEFNGNNNLTTRYTHGPATDQPLSLERNNQDYFYHADHLGTIRHLTNAAGGVANTYEYDAFGQRTITTEGVTQPYRFTGREFDDETGLYYYRARYYDAESGRFLQEDPIGFDAADLNLYRYVFNQPIDFTDPSGEILPLLAILIGGASVTLTVIDTVDTVTDPCLSTSEKAGNLLVNAVISAIGAKLIAKGISIIRKAAKKSVDDLVRESKPGTKTKGRTRQFDRSGGFDQANKDFDDLAPTNVRDIDTPFGKGRTGTLPDGKQVTVRPGSSNGGPPTLEIQQGKGRIKFRFKE